MNYLDLFISKIGFVEMNNFDLFISKIRLEKEETQSKESDAEVELE